MLGLAVVVVPPQGLLQGLGALVLLLGQLQGPVAHLHLREQAAQVGVLHVVQAKLQRQGVGHVELPKHQAVEAGAVIQPQEFMI